MFVEKEWQNFMSDSFIIQGRHLKPKNQTSNNSLIFEKTIMEVLNRPGLDFGSDYPVPKLSYRVRFNAVFSTIKFYKAECKSNKHVSDPDICPKLNTTPQKILSPKNILICHNPKERSR